MGTEPFLYAEGVHAGYGDLPVLEGVDFEVHQGRVVGIVGPNGAGKTTLLRVLTGVIPVRKGRVILEGRRIDEWSRRAVARRLAVLPQAGDILFDFTVGDIVSMGRLPHQSLLTGETAEDREAVAEALRAVGMQQYARRSFLELSGGERQRAIMARALAQRPRVLLLDEPTSHLDLGHQRAVMSYARALAGEHGLAVVTILHDLNTASLYCDELVVLFGGTVFARGTPEEVLRPEVIREVYGAEVEIVTHPRLGTPQVLISPRPHK